MKKTLVQLQTEAVQAMLQPRSSEKRAAKHRGSVLRDYSRIVAKRGFHPSEILMQRQDIIDMWKLEEACDDHADTSAG